MTSTRPFHRIQWTPAPLSSEPLNFTKVVFMVDDPATAESQHHRLAAYQEELVESGYTVIVASHSEVSDVLTPGTGTAVIHIPHAAPSRENVYSAAVGSCASLIALAQALVPISLSRPGTGDFDAVKLFSLVVTDGGISDLGYAPLHGLARVLKMEIPDLFGGLVEMESPGPVGFPMSVIKYARGFDIVRVCGDEKEGVPQTASLQPLLSQDEESEERPPVVFDPDSAYLITGGTKGVGLETASWMTEHGARHLILVSRHGVGASGTKGASAGTPGSRIAEMEARGAIVHVLAIDLSLPGAELTLREGIDRLRSPVVKGVVHAAGTARYQTLKACTPADIDSVFAPKVRGALSLDALFPPGTLDFFLLVSSIGQLVGFSGQLSYASANAFLDGLATRRRREGDNSISVQWTVWRGVGLSVQTKSATRMINKGLIELGLEDIRKEEALEAWGHILGFQTDQVAVVRALELDAEEPLRHPILKDITPRRRQRELSDYPKHAVAVVAMACRTAAGDTPDELWQALQTGQSTVRIDAVRFPEASGRTKNRLWGHFLPDIKSFDHNFFGKSKRDAAAMDPHQRLMLETTYHALEAASWVGGEQSAPETHDVATTGHITGCFVGMDAPDYTLNLGSQPPSPYTGGGMMRSLVAGRVSHHFGWTGPSQTIDTACSSSMVAIHQACRALQVGECTRAIAGGVNLIPNTVIFDALHTAGFLSQTGPCKTFDTAADGYCRGEAVGVLGLKPLERALQDGDEIQGVLLATGNNQSMNTTSITNPVLESQCALYRDVLARGGVHAHDISYVEAHGTGTRAGDPVEVEGIRQVMGGQDRRSVLHIGGVKPNVGHSEAAAGVISLIKVLLMLKHGKIPPQAQFKTLNPSIAALEPDQMAIATSLSDWNDHMRLAMVNSFGASGSNAAAVVAPPPARSKARQERQCDLAQVSEWPIFVSAASKSSLVAFCGKMRQYIGNKVNDIALSRLAFALATKCNGRLQHRLCTTARSLQDLQSQLGNPEIYKLESEPKPIVLLFSGQNGSSTPAVKSLYESSLLFRSRLHQCEEAMLALGLPSVIPTILNVTSDSDDLVLRHAALFSIQYACGMSWIDSGVTPRAVCGQSFGEWAALTVSGALTLEAGMKLVTGRASIIQKLWGADTGSMLAIEADLISSNTTPVQHLQSLLNNYPWAKLEIACYNGPNNYVVAGSTQDIEVLATHLQDQKAQSTFNKNKLRFKVLRGLHAYHCYMADSIVNACAELSASIPFQQPTFPFVSCHHPEGDEAWTWKGPTANIIACNTRSPVYFGDAMQRVAARLGRSCTFLEAGVGGPVIAMAQSALVSTEHKHIFVRISGADPMGSLAAATATLWKTSRCVQFWPFHRSQSASFLTPQGRSVDLPPYQFKKHRHWVEYKASFRSGTEINDDAARSCPHCHKSLDDFPYIVQEGPQSQQGPKSTISFNIDTRSRRYQQLISGHVVVGNPLCPVGMYLELVTHAVRLLQDGTNMDNEVGFEAVGIKAPLGLDTQRCVKCILSKKQENNWRFEIFSTPKDAKLTRPTSHCTGVVYCSNVTTSEDTDAATDTTKTWTAISSLLEDSETEALGGAMVYRTFAAMATYSPPYRGLRYIAGKGSECAGEIKMPTGNQDAITPKPNERVLHDALILDNFMQVAGIFVHLLYAANEEEGLQGSTSHICTGVELVRPLEGVEVIRGTKYRVYTQVMQDDGRAVVLDLFAFDSNSQQMVWSAQGLRVIRIPRSSLVKTLAKANPVLLTDTEEPRKQEPDRFVPVQSPQSDNSDEILTGVQEIVSRCLDVPITRVKREALLEELGYDSLVSSEVIAGIFDRFSVNLSLNDLAAATDVASLCDIISSQLNGNGSRCDNGSISNPGSAENKCWQTTVIQILSSALELDTADIDLGSRLEDLGADSLVAPEIISNLKEALGVDISSGDFAGTVDVMSLCELIGDALRYMASASSSSTRSADTPCSDIDPASDQESTIKSKGKTNPETTPTPMPELPLPTATSMLLYQGTPSQTSSPTRNLFLTPGGPGHGRVYNHLGRILSQIPQPNSICIYALTSPFTAFNLLSAGPDSPNNTIPTVEDLAASYTAEIKRRQPHGPYRVGGYSFGGIVSFEVVRQFLEAGDEVEKLVLLDTLCPSTDSSMWIPDAVLSYIRPRRPTSGAGDIALAQEQLRHYRFTKLPNRDMSLLPTTILVSARYGVDKTYTRQEDRGFSVPGEQRRITEWFLNDRMDGSLGWEELVGKGNVSVVRADGDHYTMMMPVSKMHEWVKQLVEMLEIEPRS